MTGSLFKHDDGLRVAERRRRDGNGGKLRGGRKPGAGEIVGLAGAGEDDEADLGVTEDGELPRLLQQASPPLGEGHLPRRRVVDPPDQYLSPSHPTSLSHSFSGMEMEIIW